MKAREVMSVPSLSRRHTRRPRLTRLLDATPAQIILFTAPAGYGKTSLASEWLTGRPEVGWYRATESSADVAAFSAGIADVVAPLVPGAGERLKQRLRIAEPPERAARPLAELLAEDLEEWPRDAWLVVDDYHLVVDSAPVESFVDWLLTLAPVRLLVTSRRRPGWASARRVLYGELTEITRDQLAMTNEEAARVLEGHPVETVRALVTQAQGWPALIGLAAISQTAEAPTERVAEGLFRYFAEEVLRVQPLEVRNFMLLAAVPQTIDATVARDALELAEPEETLERLADEGLLQESGPGEYVFHPLLHDFLRRKLEVEQPDAVAPLYRRAIAHARSASRWEDAFALALSRGWLDEATEIIGIAGEELLASGQLEVVEKWLDECGSATLDRPDASLVRVEVLLRVGALSEAAGLALEVSERVGTDSPLLSHSLYLAGQASHLNSYNEPALEFHERARTVAQTNRDLSDALWGMVSTGSELEIDIDAYIGELKEIPDPDHSTRLQAGAATMLAATRAGRLGATVAQMRALLPLVDGRVDPLIGSNFVAHLAYLELLRARYRRAYELSTRAEQTCRNFRLALPATLCQFVKASSEIGLRLIPQAMLTLEEFERSSFDSDDPYLDVLGSIVKLRLAVTAGTTRRLLTKQPHPVYAGAPRGAAGELIGFYALARASCGQLDAAAELSEMARRHTQELGVHYLSGLTDVVIRHERNKGHTWQGLDELLERITGDELFDAFVVSYRACPALLRAALVSEQCAPALAKVLALAGDSGRNRATTTGTFQMLTPRESEVLELMSLGLSNAGIARRLVIAESTAKRHVHNILAKLGVRSRLEAALLARTRPED